MRLHSHPNPPWYNPPLSASSRRDPIGDNRHPSHFGRENGDSFAAYLSSSRPLIGANLSPCFGGGLPGLMAGDLNAKHVDWNLRLSTRREKLLRDYADDNSCLIFGQDSPTTNPYNPSVTADVLDIVITKKLSFPTYLTLCSALSSDHLPFLIDTQRTALTSGALTGPTSRHIWRNEFLSIRNCTRWLSTPALRTFPEPF